MGQAGKPRRGGVSHEGGSRVNNLTMPQQPKRRKGRPSTPAAKHAARTKKRLEAQRTALFTARYLFVQQHLSKTERKTLWRVSRGLPQSCTTRRAGSLMKTPRGDQQRRERA